MNDDAQRPQPSQLADEVPLSGGTPQTATSPTVTPETMQEHNRPPAPLGLADSRFTMLRANLLKELRKKFIKLFKHTPDNEQRVLPDEMAVFLSLLAFEELKQIDIALRGQPQAVRAAHDPFIVFMKVLQQLVDNYHRMTPSIAAPPQPAEAEKSDDNATVANGAEGAVQQD